MRRNILPAVPGSSPGFFFLHFHSMANQKLVTEPTVTWAGPFADHTKFSGGGRERRGMAGESAMILSVQNLS